MKNSLTEEEWCGRWWRQEVTLPQGNADGNQEIQFLLTFDPFGDDQSADLAAEGHQGLNQRLPGGRGVDGGD